MAIQILMPALSPTMTEGTLSKWLKKEGDVVVSGDLLAEIETDKATMELEAIDDGVLGKIIVPEGTEGIAVNAPIAVILEDGEDASAAENLTAAPQPAAAPSPSPSPTPSPTPEPAAPAPARVELPSEGPESAGQRLFASPLARRIAADSGLDLSTIAGTGPKGRIVKRDVDGIAPAQASPQPAAETVSEPVQVAPEAPIAVETAPPPLPVPHVAPALPATVTDQAYTDIPNSNIRKIIAQRLTESSRDIPHFFLTVDCEIDRLLALRKDLNGRSPEGEGAYKISVNDFVIRAVALAMRKVPAVNASWTDEAIRLYRHVDVAIAVATEDGLITPIIRNADHKGLAQTSIEMKELAARARDNKLMPEEFQGGGFTISNMGMYGIKDFCAIINPPQSCILAVGAGEQRPIVKDGALAVATIMSCTLSVDHRSVDGALGAEFLKAFKSLIEDPLTMLL